MEEERESACVPGEGHLPVVTVVTLVPFLLVSPAAGRDLAVHRLLGAERPAPLPPIAALRGHVYSRFTDEETEAQRRFHRVWPTLVATVLASILSPPSSRRSAPQACFWEGRPTRRGLGTGGWAVTPVSAQGGRRRGGSRPRSRGAPGARAQQPRRARHRGANIRLVGRGPGRLTGTPGSPGRLVEGSRQG